MIKNLINWKSDDKFVYIILLSSPLLLSIYITFFRFKNFLIYFPEYRTNTFSDYYGYIFQHISFFVLLLIIPLILTFFLNSKLLNKSGFQLSNYKTGLKFLAYIIPIVIVMQYFSTELNDVRQEYPLCKSLIYNHNLIFSFELIYVLFYYIAWEYYFRGFMLFGLEERFGGMNAILIQTIASCLVHIGKPDGELIGSIFFGIILGIIALRTRSFWYGFFIHATLGVSTDLFIIYTK